MATSCTAFRCPFLDGPSVDVPHLTCLGFKFPKGLSNEVVKSCQVMISTSWWVLRISSGLIEAAQKQRTGQIATDPVRVKACAKAKKWCLFLTSIPEPCGFLSISDHLKNRRFTFILYHILCLCHCPIFSPLTWFKLARNLGSFPGIIALPLLGLR